MVDGGISVVTPTLGNPHRVWVLLESMGAAGDKADVPWEHIVVDSTPGAGGAAIEAVCRQFDVTYVRGPDRVGAKRNVGAARARYGVILFVDSDCRADPRLLSEHLASYDWAADVGAVGGPHDLDGTIDTFAMWVLHWAKRYDYRNNLPRRFVELGWNLTANFSVRADVLRAVGGFAEDTLTVVGGEDVDLGLRIRKAGYRIVGNPDALVLHSPETSTTLRRAARRVYMYGQACSWLGTRHPELTGRHANPVLLSTAAAVAGLLAGRRLPLAVRLAAGPAVLAALVARESANRHKAGTGARGVLRDVLSAVFDLSFEAGQIDGAVRLGRPHLAARTFDFVPMDWFVRNPDADPGCGQPGCLCVSCD
jgi:GT2 family glycosyltransferase